MLTDVSSTVDAPRVLMWTVSQIADRDGISKQAVSKRVRDMAERQGLSVERDARGCITALNVAEYDHLRGRFADPSKAQAERRPMRGEGPSSPANESYDEALRQKTWHEAEKRRIELAEMKGELLRRDKVTAALAEVAERIVHAIDRIPRAADDIAAAVAKDGTHGARSLLKAEAQRLRAEITRVLDGLSDEAPEVDADRPEVQDA